MRAGEFSSLSSGFDFGAEVIAGIGGGFSLGLGAGHITASNKSTLDGSDGINSVTEILTASLSAIPITLNVHCLLPIGSSFNLRVFAGPGIYISKFQLGLKLDTTLVNEHIVIDFDPAGVTAFGFQGGVGLEIGLAPSTFLIVDIAGRMANPSGFAGGWTRTGTMMGLPFNASGTGTLWYQEQLVSGVYCAGFDITDTAPSGASKRNVREASVSLSGLCARIGIKIAL